MSAGHTLSGTQMSTRKSAWLRAISGSARLFSSREYSVPRRVEIPVGIPVLPYCVLHCIVRHMVETSAPFSKLELELRRGAIVLAALSQLKTAQYGYSLRQALAARGMEIEEGTLYPLLRRLEGQGLLTSEWQIRDGPPRRYYVLSADGEQLYARLSTSWRALSVVMDDLIDDGAGQ